MCISGTEQQIHNIRQAVSTFKDIEIEKFNSCTTLTGNRDEAIVLKIQQT